VECLTGFFEERRHEHLGHGRCDVIDNPAADDVGLVKRKKEEKEDGIQ
jgi:hypothetical protein